MQNKQRLQGDKWLGLIMIGVAVIIALADLATFLSIDSRREKHEIEKQGRTHYWRGVGYG